jgi:serine/threonine-protein kinase ULK4
VVNIKIRLASIIGLLIRHATVIENELSGLGIANVLIEVMKLEKSEKVKRRCMAALGEYLFYGATQIDEDPQNTVWDMSSISYQTILKTIKTSSEDDIVKYYATKTVENITAQSVQTGQKFSNQELCLALI